MKLNKKQNREFDGPACKLCRAIGAVLGGEEPSWWGVRGNLCISCFAQLSPFLRGGEEDKIQEAYSRRKSRKRLKAK